MTAAHPNDRELSDFLLGKLADSQFSEIESHLGDCVECGERALKTPAQDTLVELLTAAQTLVEKERSVAATPTLDGIQTPPAYAPTLAYEGATEIADDLPPVLANHPKYSIVRRLGIGGMGSVWLAEHTVMNRPVAIKVIRPDLLSRPGAADRFLREVRAAARLHHPNIVTAFDAEQVGDSCLLVMEYVPGETLGDRLQSGPLPIPEACRAIRDAARGLAVAHKAGLVHRDVKPHNLIRDSDGTTKVLDFGLAGVGAGEVIAANGEGLTGAGMVVGTPAYIAPEQIVDPHSADARADIYGLGCTLYHLLSGKPPVPEGSITDTLAAQHTYMPEPIAQLPASLSAVLTRMIAKRPEDRFQTASEVAIAIEPYCRARSASEGESVTLAYASGSKARGIRRWLALAAGILLLVVAGVVFKIQRDNQEITITTNDDDVEVVMKRKGEVVRVIDKKSGQTWEIDTKSNQIGLADSEDGLTLPLPDSGSLVMKRKGDKDAKPVFTIARLGRPGSAAAAEAIERFMKLLDEKKLGQCWDEGAPILHEAISKEEFIRKTEGLLKPLGEFKERAEFMRQSAGDQFVIGYKSTYANGERQETTAAWRGKDKLWRVGSYQVAPPQESNNSEDGIIHKLRWPSDDAIVFWPTFSPDGKYFLASSADASPTTVVWETVTGKLVTIIPAGLYAVFMPDNRHVLATGRDSRLALWDIVSDKEIRKFEPHSASANTLSVSADGTRAVSSDDTKTFVVWDVAKGKPFAELQSLHEGKFTVRISPDGKRIATVGLKDRQAMLWEVDNKRVIWAWKSKDKGLYGPITWLPDGRNFVTAVDSEGSIVRFDEGADAPKWLWESSRDKVWAISPDGGKALMRNSDGRVHGQELSTNRNLGTVTLPRDVRAYMAISPDGKYGVVTAPSSATKGPARVYMFRLSGSSAESGWTPLFNGKDLDGWYAKCDARNWTFSDGVVIGKGVRPDALITKRTDFENFHLRLEAKINKGGNSGVLFRSGGPHSYELEIALMGGDNVKTGSLWNYKPGVLYSEKRDLIQPDAWFRVDIIAQGDHIVTKINGETTADVHDDASRKGRLELQVWQMENGNTFVQFRNVEVKELPPTGTTTSEEAQIEAAIKAADAWLKLIDAGKYGEGWEQGVSFAKKLARKEDSVRAYEQMAQHLGKSKSPRVLSKRELLPDNVVALEYAASFEKLNEAVERLLMKRDVDGEWRAMTYTPMARPAAQKSDNELILGTWRGVAAEIGGQAMPQQFIDMLQPTLTLTADKMTGKPHGTFPKPLIDMAVSQGMLPKEAVTIVEKGTEGIFHLEPTKSPKQIDFTILGEVRKTGLGIYELNGDMLKLSISIDPEKVSQRPREFASKQGEQQVVITLKRMSAKDLILEDVERRIDPAKTDGKNLPFALLERDGMAAIRFGKWLVVFEGVACDARGTVLFGVGAFYLPGTGGQGRFVDPGLKRPAPPIHQQSTGRGNVIGINNYEFKMEGKGTRLEFSDHTYDATDKVQTIVIARDGTTKLVSPPPKK